MRKSKPVGARPGHERRSPKHRETPNAGRVDDEGGMDEVGPHGDIGEIKAAFARAAVVVRETVDGGRPKVWVSDRYSAQQNHAEAQQTRLARDVAYGMETSEDDVVLRLKLWFDAVFAFAKRMTDFTQSIMRTKRRALERRIDDILQTSTKCPIARELLAKIARARDQLLTFCDFPGEVEPTNNGSERAPRPAAIQRKVTNGFRAKWAADHDTAARTTLDTARLGGGEPFQTILRRSRSDAKTASGAVRSTRALQIAKFTPPLGSYLLTTRFTVSRFIPAKSAPAFLCPYERGASRDLRAARKTPPPTISSPHPRSCASGTYRLPDVWQTDRRPCRPKKSALFDRRASRGRHRWRR